MAEHFNNGEVQDQDRIEENAEDQDQTMQAKHLKRRAENEEDRREVNAEDQDQTMQPKHLKRKCKNEDDLREENAENQDQTMQAKHLKRRSENEEDRREVNAENQDQTMQAKRLKRTGENEEVRREVNAEDQDQSMHAKHLKRKGENVEDQARADTKRPMEKNGKDLTSPDIAVNGVSSSSTFHNENQAQQQPEENRVSGYSSTVNNWFRLLHDREFGSNITKLPNIFRDYHLQTFDIKMRDISQLVMADDIIYVIHANDKGTCIVPFKRHPDQISAFTDADDKHIINQFPWKLYCPSYNPYNHSLIMIAVLEKPQIFISVEIPSIKAGVSTTTHKQLFQGMVYDWDLDIPNCRGMIYNQLERMFMFFELKKYRQLFTIREPASNLQYPIQSLPALYYNRRTTVPKFKFGSPANPDMVIHQNVYEKSIFFRIYSKRNGTLRKLFFLPLYGGREGGAEFVQLCGSDRMVVQQVSRQVEVVDISCENPVVIKRTNIRTTFEPYYLNKSSKFICYDRSDGKVRVCNLEGEILVTLRNHRMNWMSFSWCSHITKSEDIIISVWMDTLDSYSIIVSNIVTGECLAKISMGISNCSEIRKKVLKHFFTGFAYDERTHEIFTANSRGVCCVWSNRFYNDVGDINELYEIMQDSSEYSSDEEYVNSSDEEDE